MNNLTTKQMVMLDKMSRFVLPSISIGTLLKNMIDSITGNPVVTGTPVNAVNSTVTLTMDTIPTANDTLTIGAKVFTWVATGTANANGQINIGADLATSKTNIIAAIKGTDGYNTVHPTVTCPANFTGNNIVITATTAGVVGNTLVSTETFTALTNIFSGVVLSAGINGTIGVDGQMFKDVTYLYVCTGTNTISDKNWRRVSLGAAY